MSNIKNLAVVCCLAFAMINVSYSSPDDLPAASTTATEESSISINDIGALFSSAAKNAQLQNEVDKKLAEEQNIDDGQAVKSIDKLSELAIEDERSQVGQENSTRLTPELIPANGVVAASTTEPVVTATPDAQADAQVVVDVPVVQEIADAPVVAVKPTFSGGSKTERNFSFENTYITRNSARAVQSSISNRMLYKIHSNEPIWVSINYDNSKQNETVGLGYKTDTIGAVIGYDFINDSDMSFGAVAAFESAKIDYSGAYGKSADGKQYSGFAGLYGSYTYEGFDIYASSLFGYTNYKLNRLLQNESAGLAHSKYSGLSFCNKMSTDYMFESGSLRFGPEVSLYFDVVNQKKSSEKSNTYTILHNSTNDVYLSGEFGVKVTSNVTNANKSLVPHAFIGYYSDIYKRNSKRKCHDANGNVVKEIFNNKKHNSVVVKCGLDMEISESFTASVDYIGYIGKNVKSNEVAAAISYKF